jgi:hypothetical protein
MSNDLAKRLLECRDVKLESIKDLHFEAAGYIIGLERALMLAEQSLMFFSEHADQYIQRRNRLVKDVEIVRDALNGKPFD